MEAKLFESNAAPTLFRPGFPSKSMTFIMSAYPLGVDLMRYVYKLNRKETCIEEGGTNISAILIESMIY